MATAEFSFDFWEQDSKFGEQGGCGLTGTCFLTKKTFTESHRESPIILLVKRRLDLMKSPHFCHLPQSHGHLKTKSAI